MVKLGVLEILAASSIDRIPGGGDRHLALQRLGGVQAQVIAHEEHEVEHVGQLVAHLLEEFRILETGGDLLVAAEAEVFEEFCGLDAQTDCQVLWEVLLVPVRLGDELAQLVLDLLDGGGGIVAQVCR